MASKAVGIRIPDDLLNLVEAYGKENFAKGDDYDKTETLLSLIRKGLGLDSVQQSVDLGVLQSVQRKLDNCLTRDELEPFEKKLEEFDKGFQSWGSTVNEHDQILHDKILSKSIATKEDLQMAIASLKSEIELIKKI